MCIKIANKKFPHIIRPENAKNIIGSRVLPRILFKGRVKIMKTKSIMTGVGIGMAVGGATAYLKGAMAGTRMTKNMGKRMKKAMKSVEGIMGDMKYMFK